MNDCQVQNANAKNWASYENGSLFQQLNFETVSHAFYVITTNPGSVANDRRACLGVGMILFFLGLLLCLVKVLT